nr:hypothetical protein [uncultured Gellertiella sp.]
MSDMYIASPDWLKLAWIVLPCATICGVAWIWGRGRVEVPPEIRAREAEWVELRSDRRPPTALTPPRRPR